MSMLWRRSRHVWKHRRHSRARPWIYQMEFGGTHSATLLSPRRSFTRFQRNRVFKTLAYIVGNVLSYSPGIPFNCINRFTIPVSQEKKKNICSFRLRRPALRSIALRPWQSPQLPCRAHFSGSAFSDPLPSGHRFVPFFFGIAGLEYAITYHWSRLSRPRRCGRSLLIILSTPLCWHRGFLCRI